MAYRVSSFEPSVLEQLRLRPGRQQSGTTVIRAPYPFPGDGRFPVAATTTFTPIDFLFLDSPHAAVTGLLKLEDVRLVSPSEGNLLHLEDASSSAAQAFRWTRAQQILQAKVRAAFGPRVQIDDGWKQPGVLCVAAAPEGVTYYDHLQQVVPAAAATGSLATVLLQLVGAAHDTTTDTCHVLWFLVQCMLHPPVPAPAPAPVPPAAPSPFPWEKETADVTGVDIASLDVAPTRHPLEDVRDDRPPWEQQPVPPVVVPDVPVLETPVRPPWEQQPPTNTFEFDVPVLDARPPWEQQSTNVPVLETRPPWEQQPSTNTFEFDVPAPIREQPFEFDVPALDARPPWEQQSTNVPVLDARPPWEQQSTNVPVLDARPPWEQQQPSTNTFEFDVPALDVRPPWEQQPSDVPALAALEDEDEDEEDMPIRLAEGGARQPPPRAMDFPDWMREQDQEPPAAAAPPTYFANTTEDLFLDFADSSVGDNTTSETALMDAAVNQLWVADAPSSSSSATPAPTVATYMRDWRRACRRDARDALAQALRGPDAVLGGRLAPVTDVLLDALSDDEPEEEEDEEDEDEEPDNPLAELDDDSDLRDF